MIPFASAEDSSGLDLIDYSDNSLDSSDNSYELVSEEDFINLNDKNILKADSTELENSEDSIVYSDDEASNELIKRIINAEENETILIEAGTYYINGLNLTKSITLQGNGDPNDIIIDGEEKASVFLINSINVTAHFYNLTIMNGFSTNFGGGICIETGNTYVDNCIFINNTAFDNTNGGAISNYGNAQSRSYLFVNNSLFIGNYADHDGGAVTTCYATSDIYNSVFMNNSARRDGGAIRVSVFGYGNVQDCIFMFNHADEWGGAYYSWAGNSSIDRCIFVNNTAGTNGGAVMVSGSLNLTNSLIANNEGGETGGSFYIQQPMFDALTKIKVNNNIITNNSAPYGQEIFVKWNATQLLYPNFNYNDWGDEDPNDSSVVDPNNVSSRMKVTSTKNKGNLYDELKWDLLDRYSDILDESYKSVVANFKSDSSETENSSSSLRFDNNTEESSNNFNKVDSNIDNNTEFNNLFESETNSSSSFVSNSSSNSSSSNGFSKNTDSIYMSPGYDGSKAVELIKDNTSSSKSTDIRFFVVLVICVFVFLIGLSRRRN